MNNNRRIETQAALDALPGALLHEAFGGFEEAGGRIALVTAVPGVRVLLIPQPPVDAESLDVLQCSGGREEVSECDK